MFSKYIRFTQRIVPCAITLLPDKTEATYTRMFAEIQHLIGGVSPNKIMFDFEKSAMNAAGVFLGIIFKGCNYQITSNIWKKFQFRGL